MGKRQCKALTNWLRSVAEDEPSRPILQIDEEGATLGESMHRRDKAIVYVSAALKQKTPSKHVGNLGHVGAGLLLWLESSAEDDGDV
jgi:hypothetical protein